MQAMLTCASLRRLASARGDVEILGWSTRSTLLERAACERAVELSSTRTLEGHLPCRSQLRSLRCRASVHMHPI